ncbi:MAG: hypothetical protein ACM3VT_03995 [Solirubrobacterales bacterium]
MVEPNDSHDTPAEYVFDIAKPAGRIEFCGLIEGFTGPENNLVGLFRWTCAGCGDAHHDAAAIQPNQSFLAEWSCAHCGGRFLARFRARPASDWVAQHALAITGRALCRQAERGAPQQVLVPPQGKARRSGQKMFGWIALPLLGAIIIVGSLDFKRIQASSAKPQESSGLPSSSPYSWLGGHWISASSGDMLTFCYMNAAAGRGAYTQARRDGTRSRVVRFQIVHDDTKGGRLVLRESSESADSATPRADGSDAILYVTKNGDSVTRVAPSGGTAVITAYHRQGKPSVP